MVWKSALKPITSQIIPIPFQASICLLTGSPLKIIVAGIIGRYPWGGVTWCSLMYLLGLLYYGYKAGRTAFPNVETAVAGRDARRAGPVDVRHGPRGGTGPGRDPVP